MDFGHGGHCHSFHCVWLQWLVGEKDILFFVDWNVLQVQNKGAKLKASESRKSFRINAPRMYSPLYSAWESNLNGTFALGMGYWWKRGNWKKKKEDSSRVGKMPTKWTKEQKEACA